MQTYSGRYWNPDGRPLVFPLQQRTHSSSASISGFDGSTSKKYLQIENIQE